MGDTGDSPCDCDGVEAGLNRLSAWPGAGGLVKAPEPSFIACGVEEPEVFAPSCLRAVKIARWYRVLARLSCSFVSMSVNIVSSSGGGESQLM